MQPKFQHDADKHSPQVGPGMAHYSSNFEQEQADQWAVLRHEVEDETVKRNDERAGAARSDWDQRDTEDDSPVAHNPYDREMIEQTPNHVNIVVAGVGGGGMNAVTRPDPEATVNLLSRILRGTPRLPNAACASRPEGFTSTDPGHVDAAIAICRDCPDRAPCQRWADSDKTISGVVGGVLRLGSRSAPRAPRRSAG